MALSTHPSNLQAFIDGQLNETETAGILDHLAKCDRCLAIVDRLWAKHPASLIDPSVPELDTATAQRIEERVVKRIHRSDLNGKLVWLGTVGMMSTSLTMFEPMIESYLKMLSFFSKKGDNPQIKKEIKK